VGWESVIFFEIRGERLDEQPIKVSLGLLPSGPDPVGELYVRCQPLTALYGAEASTWQDMKTAKIAGIRKLMVVVLWRAVKNTVFSNPFLL
jgi:hypothetical protein